MNVDLWTVRLVAGFAMKVSSKKALMQTGLVQLKGMGIVLKPDSTICCPAS